MIEREVAVLLDELFDNDTDHEDRNHKYGFHGLRNREYKGVVTGCVRVLYGMGYEIVERKIGKVLNGK